MAKVENKDRLLQALRQRIKDMEEEVVVTVGYTAQYAVHVHENLTARHPVGQAKFLEQPAREMSRQIGEGIKAKVKRGMPLSKALLIEGLGLQRASQQLVPVNTGNLKGSAFTRLEE